jgi:amino acid adenylation domain-containing protein
MKVRNMPNLSQDSLRTLPLSEGQQQQWFFKQFNQAAVALNHVTGIQWDGSFQVDLWRQALSELVTRYSALRTSFVVENSKQIQVIEADGTVYFESRQLDESQLQAEIRRLSQHRFSYDKALWQVSHFELAETKHVLICVLDQLIADRQSATTFLIEALTMYAALARHEVLAPANPDTENLNPNKVIQESDLAFWKSCLEDAAPLNSLPVDYLRPAVRNLAGASVHFEIDAELTRKLQKLDARLEDTMLALFSTLIARYTHETDFVIGVERNSQTAPYIGQFADALPIRFCIEDNPAFSDWLVTSKAAREDAKRHANLSFNEIISAVKPQRDMSYSPIFQILFSLREESKPFPTVPSAELTQLKLSSGTSVYDLSFIARLNAGLITAAFEYDTALFSANKIQRMVQHFLTLIQAVCENPKTSLGLLKMLTQAETETILKDWLTTAGPSLEGQTIHGLFEAQVERSSDASAILMENRNISYAELNAYANQLARYLVEQGVQDGDVVGVCIERSLDVIIANLAVLKVGAAYAPLDPTYPAERLMDMIADCGAKTVISRPQYQDLLAQFHETLLYIETDWADNGFAAYSNGNLGVKTSNKIACVLFTSGSTGKPKGVKSGHNAIVNRLYWWVNQFPLAEDEVWVAKSALNVVDSVWEFYGALLFGVKLVVIPENTLANIRLFVETLAQHKISRVVMVPSLLRAVLEEDKVAESLSALKIWIATGELLQGSLLQNFREKLPDRTILNFYGCSENPTIAVSNLSQANGFADVHIGRPRNNVKVYLLDKYLQPVPVGVSGEIFVGGIGLSDGYVNRPELMNKTFVRNPFEANGLLYRTGDIAQYLEDGNIKLIGRSDFQIKIRGFRVEVGEVESRLKQAPQVNNVLVLAKENEYGEAYLVAYYVSNTGKALSTQTLREFLGEKLPSYMIPGAFVHLEAFPLFNNGKINRHALPEPSRERTDSSEHVAASNALESQLTAIWAEVLGINRIGIHDNFFDLGGHSLSAAVLLAAIEDKLGKRLPIASLFREPTIAQLAKAISGNQADLPAGANSLIPIQVGDESRLPFFWLHSSDFTYLKPHFDPAQPFYCIMPSGMNAGEAILATEDEIADHHLKVIQALQAEGPYLLGGYCNGGKNAIAVAQRLKEQGQEVRLLALVDVPVPDEERKVAKKKPLYQRVLRLLGEGRILNIIKQKIRDRINPAEEQEIETPETEQLKAIVSAHDSVFDFWVMNKVYQGKLNLFTCEENYNHLGKDLDMRWGKLSTESIAQHIVPGNHFTMIRQPNIQVLGKELMEIINAAQEIKN